MAGFVVTVTVQVAVTSSVVSLGVPLLAVTVMVAVPAFTGRIAPFIIIATAGLLDVQLTYCKLLYAAFSGPKVTSKTYLSSAVTLMTVLSKATEVTLTGSVTIMY